LLAIAGPKSVPVSSGCYPKTVLKSPPKGVRTPEADRGCNCIDRNIGGKEAAPRFIQSMALDENARWLAKGAFEAPREMPGRKAGAPRQGPDGKIAIGIVRDPTGQSR